LDLRKARYKTERLATRWKAGLAARVRIGLCGGMVAACRRALRDGVRPNVIVVTVDSWRADRAGYLRREPTLTPNLDTWAAESVCFTKAITPAPWTKPAASSLLTGLYPSVHGANVRGAFGAKVTEDAERAQANVMRSGLVTLGELLTQAGYTTAAFTGGGFTHAVYQSRGFQHFYGSGHGLHDLFYQCARWFAGRPASPFFVWLHAYDTHRPYRGRFPLARFVRRRPFNLTNADVKAINSGQLVLTPDQQERLVRLYDTGVQYADRQIGLLLHVLRSSGLLNHTILVFTSDHGEALYEHGLVEHWDVVYNEVLRVPLLIRVPGVQPGTVDQYVRLMDLMPTLLELAGVPVPEVQGASLLPAMLDGDDLRLAAFSELETAGRPRALQCTLRGRDYKIIWWMDSGRISFFDLTADPGETRDLWGQDTPVERQLLARLDAQLKENGAWAARFEGDVEQEPEVGWEVEQRLRDLGYID